jgi:hypothetical protein
MKRHLTAGQGAREGAEPSRTCWAGRANRRRPAPHGRGGGGGGGGRGPGRRSEVNGARGAPSLRPARAAAAMNSAEQTVTWLITLGVLESPKKTISDPEVFLQASLKDGVVLCRLLERLLPGTIEKVSAHPQAQPAPPARPGPARPGPRCAQEHLARAGSGPARPPLCADRAARRARGPVAGAPGAPLCAGRPGPERGPGRSGGHRPGKEAAATCRVGVGARRVVRMVGDGVSAPP